MEREHPQDELIDYGSATDATRGAAIGVFDQEGTLRRYDGLSDD